MRRNHRNETVRVPAGQGRRFELPSWSINCVDCVHREVITEIQ